MRNNLILLFGCFFATLSMGQSGKIFPPNNYRGIQNENYWKNRPPHGGYWQQDVHYTIFAEVDPEEDKITGQETLEYWNNSPDTLEVLYFHLYQEAFQPGSYRDQMVKARKKRPKYGPHEQEGRGTEVTSVEEKGLKLEIIQDNTILKVTLAKPLLPGNSIELFIQFNTWFDNGSERRRMDLSTVEIKKADSTIYEAKQYKGVHWYPRVAVYDQNMNWHIDQHLGKEFYGEFGTFDVALTFPNHYIVDGTGRMLNRSKVLPEDLRKRLDIANFKDKPWGETASEVIVPNGTKKTWHFHAENVHDFGFTADPTYRIGEVNWKGVKSVALAQEQHASGWQDAAEYTARIIEAYSGHMGMYIWPKIIVADASDGMEYPMMTLDGGRSPDYKGLFAHEVGHMWFFGMTGSNETYRAFMDEGFTQYLTAWCLTNLEGPLYPEYPEKDGIKQYFTRAYNGYLRDARSGYDGQLNTHSHDYHNAVGHENGYGQVYYKSATMLFNLQYVLGKETFKGAMRHYFSKWKIAHPYPDDFRKAITEYAKTDLSWFFDQWLESDKVIDYAIDEVQKRSAGTEVEITFRRKGRMRMPVDFSVVTFGGDSLHYAIPVSEYQKNDSGRIFLPKWTGTDGMNPTYTSKLSLPDKFKKVIIDPSRTLADINLLDNQSGIPPVKIRVSPWPKPQRYYPFWDKYYLNLRPSLWWNGASGLQVGASVEGDYFKTSGQTFLGVWFATGLGTTTSRFPALDSLTPQLFNYEYRYSTPIRSLGRNIEVNLHSMWRDGVHRHGLGFSKVWAQGRANNPEYSKVWVGYTLLRRQNDLRTGYLTFPNQWTVGQNNAFVQAFYEKGFENKYGNGFARFGLRSSAVGSDSRYSWADLELGLTETIGKLVFKYHAYARYGDGEVPLESALYLEGGSPEERVGDNFYRSRGFFPNSLLENNVGQETYHFHYGGGLNLRGYAGYRAEFADAGPAWYGTSGAAANVEVEFDRLIPLRMEKVAKVMKVRTYLFADAGAIGRSEVSAGFDKVEFSSFRMDAGGGVALHFDHPKAKHQKPMVIRADFPVWVSRPPALENHLKFRWLLSIGRAF